MIVQNNVLRVESPIVRHTNQNNRPAARQRNMHQQRAAEQEREMRLRELENERIHKIMEQIQTAKANESGLSDEIVNLTISMFNDQINQIHMNRAEREQLAIEREMIRQQNEMDERMRERERMAREREENSVQNKTQEEYESAQERSMVQSMTSIGIAMDNVSTLSSTRTRLSAEAGQLEREADFDISRRRSAVIELQSQDLQPSKIAHLPTFNPLAQDSFVGRHHTNLNIGIARTNAAINSQVSALYREGQRMQEEHLQLTREQYTTPLEEEQEEDAARPYHA